MPGKKRQADVVSLEERRRKRRELQLREANRQMIEAEHALFVALRLAGHRGPGNNGQPLVLVPRPVATIVPLSRMRARRKRAA